MRRILIVAHDFPPRRTSAVYRPLGWARYLPDYGWEPIVLTVEDRGGTDRDPALLDRLEGRVLIERTRAFELLRFENRLHRNLYAQQPPRSSPAPVSAVRPPSGRRGLAGAVKRVLSKGRRVVHEYLYVPDPNIGWLPFALARGKNLVRQHGIDAVLAVSAPHSSQLVGALIARTAGRPFIADFTDPWTQNFTMEHHSAWRRRIMRRLERWVFHQARQVVHVSERQRTSVIAEFPDVPPDRHCVIPNGFDEEDFSGLSPVTLEPSRGFNLLSVGTIYGDSTVDTAIDALRELSGNGLEGSVALSIVGYMPADIRRALAEPSLAGIVSDHGFQPHESALGHMIGADALLLTIPRGGAFGSNVPGRLYEMVRSGRPIIFVGAHAEIEQVLRDTGAGVCVADGDVAGFRRELERLVLQRKSGVPLQGAPLHVAHAYSWKEQAHRLADVLDRAAQARPSGS